MEHSPSKANSHSCCQQIPHLLWNPKLHYCVHKSLPLVLILGQMHPVHNFSPYFPKICSYITSHLCLGFLSGLFPSHFLPKTYAFLISLMHAISANTEDL
jgi:hypothetical protein